MIDRPNLAPGQTHPPLSRSFRLTVVAAACNEATQIAEWLEVFGWHDDGLRWIDRIVVADTGSTDGTPERLRELGVEVVSAEPARAGDGGGAVVHAAKNRAMATVESGWVLDLDFDERVPAELRDEIVAALSKDEAAVDAYRLPFRHYVFGRWLRHGGWRGKHLRLYRAGRTRYPEDRAHSTPETFGEVRDLESFVVHFAHPTIHDFWVKMNRYTSHDAPLIDEHGRGGLRNRAPLPPRRWAWSRAALSVFWNRYVKAAGFRDGVAGFIVAVLLAAYVFVEQVKVWERRTNAADSAGEVPA